jgi:hypothetical protein
MVSKQNLIGLCQLPDEILLGIISHLSKSELYFLREMCKEFKRHINYVKLRLPRMEGIIRSVYIRDGGGCGIVNWHPRTGMHPYLFSRENRESYYNWFATPALYNCINAECPYGSGCILGNVCLYYPLVSPLIGLAEDDLRRSAYSHAPFVRRFIPYCGSCAGGYLMGSVNA